MDRAERIGLGVAGAAHIALFALLSTVWLARPKPPVRLAIPMEVSFADQVSRRTAAPSREVPAPSVAPTLAEPKPAPPPAPAPQPEPTPAPPKPTPPKPAPPRPVAEKPTPAKPAPEKPAPAKPAPEKTAPPRPTPEKPAPAKAKPSPAKPQVAKPDTAKPAAAKPTAAKSTAAAHDRLSPDFLKDLPAGQGSTPAAKPARPGGARLGRDILAGLSDKPTPSKATAPAASAVSAAAMAGLGAAIQRQIRPCTDYGSLNGTSAMAIVTTLRLRFNADGSVAGQPEVVDQSGLTADNRGYARQVADVVRRAVLRCAPVHLPAELYQGGWDDLNLRFKPS